MISRGKRAVVRLVGSGAPNRPDIRATVIIPVYNTETYLRELLESLVAQDLPAEEFEVIAVNDGSTDNSGAILDEFAHNHANFRVVHQENSGWAGKPRNVALDLAQGKYVFFADSDDVLAPSALRRMLQFASDHELDVVFPKVVGLGGRWVSKGMYAKANPALSPLQAINTLTPQKLILRDLIESNRLRFEEEPVRLEDGMFMVACYLLANGIGIASGREHYSLRARADGSNISSRPLDPEGYTSSIAKIAAIVRAHARDPKLADGMILTLWSNKGLKIYAPARYRRYSETVQDRWLEEHSRFVNEFVTEESSGNLDGIRHRKTECIRRLDKEALFGIIELEEELAKGISIDGARYEDGELHLSGTVHSPDIDSVRIAAGYRGKEPGALAEATFAALDGTFSGTLPGIPDDDAIIDFVATPVARDITGRAKRTPSAARTAFSTNGNLMPYTTKHGNFSLQTVKPEPANGTADPSGD
ncbi:glycosyltransferase family 2 protein [Paeniglutamicibacter sp. R2-26]|uniref:glycosyltransferase family 2 protein n=1 Tax=Paeniglutamicibacter sp. R2-26 TaxID=3144417 RepID=UPI003EE657D1